MDSLDLCLPKALAELNLLEQYKLNTLVHKWRDVVGDVIADHTKIVSIKPPDMVISADNSMWMQELQMQKRRIIEAINKYYRQEVITDIRFIMKRQSYVKVETNTSLTIPDECVIGGDQHLCLLFRFRQGRSTEQRGVARLGELHQFLNEVLLLRRGRYMVQYLVLGRTVNAHILRRAVVRDFIIEGGKLRHFDEVAETLLLDHIVRHVKFKIRRLLGKYRRPSVETPYVLPFQLLRAQVLEQQVQFSQ